MENLRAGFLPISLSMCWGREINQFNGSEDVKNNLLELVKYLHRSLELTEKLSVFCTSWILHCIRILISKEDASAKILRQRLQWRKDWMQVV